MKTQLEREQSLPARGNRLCGGTEKGAFQSRLEPDGTRREGGGGQPPVTQDPRGFSVPVRLTAWLGAGTPAILSWGLA